MNKIGKALKTKRFDDMEVNDIDIKYHIENGVIEVEPFQVKAANTIIEISGDQGLDGNLNYNMMIDLPTSSLGTETNSVIANLTGTETTSSNTIAVNALVSGYYNDPNVKLIRGSGKGLVGNIKDNVKKKKEEVKKTVKSNVKKSTKAKAQKIINDADKQAQKVVREAEKTAGTIRYEADKAGDKLIAEAKKKGNDLITKAGNNIIKKKLAQESAKKLNKEAAKRANQLNTEADNKANKLVDEAKTKADKIRSEAQKKADAL